MFQFTPLREGRRAVIVIAVHTAEFQFTPLREGRPPTLAVVAPTQTVFQFTPLREGRRIKEKSLAYNQVVSIHAPA